MSLAAGVTLDRENTSLSRNDDGNAVFTFSVAARDRGSPPLISFTTVSYQDIDNRQDQLNIHRTLSL